MKKLLLLPILFLYSLVASAQIITATTNDCEFKFILPNLTYGAGIAANLKTTRYVSFDQIHYKRIMVNNSSPEQFQVFLTLGLETFSFSESIATSYYGITATALFNQIVAVIDASACGSGGGGGAGTVTDFIYTDGNGLDGTVTNSTTTPTLSIAPSFTGLVQSNGTAFLATTIGTGLSFAGGTLSATGGGGDWLYNGNTVVSEKWIGTIDGFDWPIRTNNVETWRFTTGGIINNGGSGVGNRFLYRVGDNTFCGLGAGTSGVSGSSNTGIGTSALNAVAAGIGHTAVGFEALKLVTNVIQGNTAIGYQAGGATTSGQYNFFGGHVAGLGNVNGNANTYVGGSNCAQYNNGNNNAWVGTDCGAQATAVSETVLMGFNVMPNVVAGNLANYNVGIGTGALNGLTGNGNKNISIGYFSGQRALGDISIFNQSTYIGAETVSERGGEIAIGANLGNMTHFFIGGSQYFTSTSFTTTTLDFGPTSAVAGGTKTATLLGAETNATSTYNIRYCPSRGTGDGHGADQLWMYSPAGASGTTGNTLTEALRIIGETGLIRAGNIHNNAFAQGSATQQDIRSGTYTPTLFNTTNIAASTAYSCQWMRVGNVITVSGKVDIDVTIGVASELGMSLPVASAFTADENAGGTASSSAAASLVSAIRADAANDRVSLVFVAISLTNDSYFFEFTYVVK